MEAPGEPLRKELLPRGRGAHYIRMLAIRFFRVGKKHQPSFKIVVTDKRKPPRAGRFVEEVGFYNPLTKEKVLKGERIKYWLSKGAKPSDTVYNLLVSEKVLEGKKRPKHKVVKKEEKEPVPEKPAEKASSAAPAEASSGKEKKQEVKKPEEVKEKKEEAPLKEEAQPAEKPAEESPEKEEKEEKTE